MTYFLDPALASLDLAGFMHVALDEADAAGQAGELPIGAVVVIDGAIVSRGRAQHKALRSDVRHAEPNAILAGGDPLWEHAKRALLFTTVEPCVLCLGAAVMADIPHIIFALPDAVVHSKQIVETHPYVRRHLKSYYGGVLAEDSTALFAKYDPRTLAYIQQNA